MATGSSGNKLSPTVTFLILAFVLPLTLLLWVVYLASVHLLSSDPEKDQIPPTRWLFSVLVPVLLARK